MNGSERKRSDPEVSLQREERLEDTQKNLGKSAALAASEYAQEHTDERALYGDGYRTMSPQVLHIPTQDDEQFMAGAAALKRDVQAAKARTEKAYEAAKNIRNDHGQAISRQELVQEIASEANIGPNAASYALLMLEEREG